jgi:menaquinone-dependent protoporphyrinogen oxidase
MTTRTLVVHASEHGSTREVAEAVASLLRDRGLDVDLVAASDAGELDRYGAVVLGSALYMGRLHGDARRFLERYRGELATRRVAVFAMGPLTTAEKDLTGAEQQLARGLGRVPEVVPIATAVFGGVLDPSEHRFPFSRMAPSDARDWDAIHAWADEVAGALAASRVPAPAA